MAARVAFQPKNTGWPYFQESLFEFEWVKGQASSQQRKGLKNFHNSIKSNFPEAKILEVSTLSEEPLGQALSAFNLKENLNGIFVAVENIYQASKLFEHGGPYLDLLNVTPLDAKRDGRLTNSGELHGFMFNSEKYDLTDSPNFYDFLYIRALLANPDLMDNACSYNFFTDFKYSQTSLTKKIGRSFNCQARALAIAVSAHKNNSLVSTLEEISTHLFKKNSSTEIATLFD